MKFDRNSILIIVLTFGVLFGYERYLDYKYPNRHKKPAKTEEVGSTPNQENQATSQPALAQGSGQAPILALNSQSQGEHVPVVGDDVLTFDTHDVKYIFNQKDGGLSKVALKKYYGADKNSPYELLDQRFTLQLAEEFVAISQMPDGMLLTERLDDHTIRFTRTKPDWKVVETVTMDSHGYGSHWNFEWINTSAVPKNLVSTVYMGQPMNHAPHKGSGFLSAMTPQIEKYSLVTSAMNSQVWTDLAALCTKAQSPQEPQPYVSSQGYQEVDFLGFDRYYFMGVFIPESKKLAYEIRAMQSFASSPNCGLVLSASLDQGQLDPGQKAHLNFKSWMGPKSASLLSSFDTKLENAVDLGWFSKIAHVLYVALHFIFQWVQNWGVAIILFTFCLKMLLYPITKNSVSMGYRTKKLAPQLEALKEKYKDDPTRQSQELMRFYSTNNINPLKGCLPLLLTAPIFFAFYRLLSTSVELRHAVFIPHWIEDLSAPDPFYISQLLLGGLMFLQQKLTPIQTTDKAQENMMLLMPVIFTLMMLTLPSGMSVYMLTNTAVQILQQLWITKQLKSSERDQAISLAVKKLA